jgi:hypothetical protein
MVDRSTEKGNVLLSALEVCRCLPWRAHDNETFVDALASSGMNEFYIDGQDMAVLVDAALRAVGASRADLDDVIRMARNDEL